MVIQLVPPFILYCNHTSSFGCSGSSQPALGASSAAYRKRKEIEPPNATLIALVCTYRSPMLAPVVATSVAQK